MRERSQVIPIRGARCRALGPDGKPCRTTAEAGSRYCPAHEPSAGSAEPAEPAWVRALFGRLDLGKLADIAARRLRGEYEVDVFGFDRELTEALLPIVEPLNKHWWRVDVLGNERIPSEGGVLLACNHAGTFPVDGMVVRSLVWEHAPHRHARMLVADLAYTLPFFSHVMRKTGNVLACAADATGLLRMGELVCVFPEGYKGIGKGWRQRYRLQRFGRGGFVEVAIRMGAPIVPVAVVGSEEAYPMLANLRPLARLLGIPYFPVTPTFPHLGLGGLIPLPSKWIVEFCEPVPTGHLGPDAANDPMTVLELTERVRQVIQETVLRNLRLRRSMFS